jgi:hypothetical protein
MDQHELEAMARAIVDSKRYMTLGTADESGLPWVSPVWYPRRSTGSSSGSRLPRRGTPATSRLVRK